jgi:hypothetical protein
VTRLQARFQFDVGQLLVRVEELGRSYELASSPTVILEMPEVPNAGDSLFIGDDRFTGYQIGSAEQPPWLLGVRVVSMSVDVEDELSAEDFPDGEQAVWPIDHALAVFDRANQLARKELDSFREWARIGGNYRMGLSHEEPPFSGVQVLVDLDADERIPIGYPRVSSVLVGYTTEQRDALPSVAEMVALVQSDQPPDLAETLLADVRAMSWPDLSAARDHQRIVLIAAIACEVKVKQRLREVSSPERAPLLDVILSNPRDVTQSVPQLLHKVCKGVTGTSLSDADNDLYGAVERLFTLRNDVAHRGRVPSEDQGRAAVSTAVRLFAWLAELGLN